MVEFQKHYAVSIGLSILFKYSPLVIQFTESNSVHRPKMMWFEGVDLKKNRSSWITTWIVHLWVTRNWVTIMEFHSNHIIDSFKWYFATSSWVHFDETRWMESWAHSIQIALYLKLVCNFFIRIELSDNGFTLTMHFIFGNIWSVWHSISYHYKYHSTLLTVSHLSLVS